MVGAECWTVGLERAVHPPHLAECWTVGLEHAVKLSCEDWRGASGEPHYPYRCLDDHGVSLRTYPLHQPSLNHSSSHEDREGGNLD